MQDSGCDLGYKASRTIQKPWHPCLVVLMAAGGGCDVNICCALSFHLPGSGGWRHMTMGIHIAQSKNKVVWAATKSIRRGGVSPWSTSGRQNVSSAYCWESTTCISPFFRAGLQMHCSPQVENNLKRECCQYKACFREGFCSQCTPFPRPSHIKGNGNYQSWQAASTELPVCQLQRGKIQ